MPRKSSTTLAVTVALGLTVGTAAAYSSQPRPDRVTSAHAAATSSASAGAGSGCARKYRNSTTKVGVNLSTVRASGREVSAQSATFRPPRVVRMWDNRSDPASAWKGMTRDLPRRTSMVLSIRHSPQEVIAGQWDNQIAAFFKQAPKHRLIFWNYFHEPEDEVQSHQFTTAQYRSAFRHVADIAARYCRHNLVPTLVLKGWTADPRSGKASRGAWKSWKSFFPGKGYVSVVAWDPYNYATVKPHNYKKPREIFRYAVRAARSVGKRWGIAETGSARVSGDAGKGRAKWLHKVARYSRRHNAAFVTYFNSTGLVNDFRLTDRPSWRAWRTEMRR
jgi:hypothetical protein